MTRLVAILAAAMLLLALAPWPYSYYLLLRVVVFAAGVFCAVMLWERERGLAIGLILCALIFNPFVPVHLTRAIWSVLNVGGAALFGLSAVRSGRVA